MRMCIQGLTVNVILNLFYLCNVIFTKVHYLRNGGATMKCDFATFKCCNMHFEMDLTTKRAYHQKMGH
ncbi:hypothetical protein L2E82_11726 [Cichorium intybus]|uniref:Uncharacterized protein n=1 Tax=Cichorium intybus TaxID=13427 RepID=A0ACB9GDL2_CICIN|nr:hypothetical protein L2E82_11726 [Cichorium intybus]